LIISQHLSIHRRIHIPFSHYLTSAIRCSVLVNSSINILSFAMVSLLDLPGEIRNMIWDLCLVSPTGMISPLSRRDAYHSGVPGSCSYSGPFFYLQVEETKTHVERCQSTCRIEPNAPTISSPSLEHAAKYSKRLTIFSGPKTHSFSEHPMNSYTLSNPWVNTLSNELLLFASAQLQGGEIK
jgi:hypothetical protein